MSGVPAHGTGCLTTGKIMNLDIKMERRIYFNKTYIGEGG